MPDTQTARMLIMSIPSLSETTVELIHATVKPLTRKGVSDYLRLYEQRHDWTSNAIREVHGVSSTSSVNKTSGSRCTETECVGPHPEKECWSRPENFDKKEKFLARRRNNGSSKPTAPKSAVKGVRKVTRPSASNIESNNVISFHTSYEDVTMEASSAQAGSSVWALHDTGATHHVFKDKSLFLSDKF